MSDFSFAKITQINKFFMNKFGFVLLLDFLAVVFKVTMLQTYVAIQQISSCDYNSGIVLSVRVLGL